MVRKIVAGLLCGIIFYGCSSTTLINTDPGVKIYVDGEYQGTGSASHTDSKIVGSSTSVTLQKEGCRSQNFTFSRTEEFDPGACAGGVFLTIPFLWIMKYKPTHTYQFTCEKP